MAISWNNLYPEVFWIICLKDPLVKLTEKVVQASPKCCIGVTQEAWEGNGGILGWNLQVSFRTKWNHWDSQPARCYCSCSCKNIKSLGQAHMQDPIFNHGHQQKCSQRACESRLKKVHNWPYPDLPAPSNQLFRAPGVDPDQISIFINHSPTYLLDFA